MKTRIHFIEFVFKLDCKITHTYIYTHVSPTPQIEFNRFKESKANTNLVSWCFNHNGGIQPPQDELDVVMEYQDVKSAMEMTKRTTFEFGVQERWKDPSSLSSLSNRFFNTSTMSREQLLKMLSECNTLVKVWLKSDFERECRRTISQPLKQDCRTTSTDITSSTSSSLTMTPARRDSIEMIIDNDDNDDKS